VIGTSGAGEILKPPWIAFDYRHADVTSTVIINPVISSANLHCGAVSFVRWACIVVVSQTLRGAIPWKVLYLADAVTMAPNSIEFRRKAEAKQRSWLL
jgi:hypothetical protein